MKVRFDLKIIIFLIVFFFTKQLSLYFITMSFALFHELAHLIVGIILKFRPEQIEIMPLGFCISMRPNSDDYKKEFINSDKSDVKKILVATAGPLINLLLIIVFAKIKMNLLVYSNLMVLILNIIPIYPLDGGRILKCIMKIFIGRKKAENVTNITANALIICFTIIGSMTILYLKNISILIILLYLWSLVIKENKRYELKKKVWNFMS